MINSNSSAGLREYFAGSAHTADGGIAANGTTAYSQARYGRWAVAWPPPEAWPVPSGEVVRRLTASKDDGIVLFLFSLVVQPLCVDPVGCIYSSSALPVIARLGGSFRTRPQRPDRRQVMKPASTSAADIHGSVLIQRCALDTWFHAGEISPSLQSPVAPALGGLNSRQTMPLGQSCRSREPC